MHSPNTFFFYQTSIECLTLQVDALTTIQVRKVKSALDKPSKLLLDPDSWLVLIVLLFIWSKLGQWIVIPLILFVIYFRLRRKKVSANICTDLGHRDNIQMLIPCFHFGTNATLQWERSMEPKSKEKWRWVIKNIQMLPEILFRLFLSILTMFLPWFLLGTQVGL